VDHLHKNVEFKITNVSTGCQYLGYFTTAKT